MALTDISIKSAKPKEKPYKLTDGEGMFLLISPNGSKLWRLKYRVANREKLLALGSYPEVSLVKAREKRMDARKLLSDGIDPSIVKKEESRNKRIKSANTFESLGREWHAKKSSGWTEAYAKTILTRLESDLFPRIGGIPITDVTPMILLDALQDIEKRGVYETTRRAKQYCGQIFRYAIPRGFNVRDITVDLKDALQTKKAEHFASIEPSELPQFLKELYRNDVRMYPTTKLAMELLLHTFVRTSELIQSKWTEFDFDGALWTIPAERMKMKKAHLVPLSTQSIAILRRLQKYNGNYEWVFASSNKPMQPMSNNAILKALERMGYRGRMTGHGFRSLAMTTILEKLDYSFDVVDSQLAHAKKHALGAAYDRAKYLTQRKQMMQDWADYLDSIAAGNVVDINFGVTA